MTEMWMDEYGHFYLKFDEGSQIYELRWVREDGLEPGETQVIASYNFLVNRIKELLVRTSTPNAKKEDKEK